MSGRNMFKSLGWLIKRHSCSWPFYNAACLQFMPVSRNCILVKPGFISVHQYGTRHSYSPYVEEETLSYKVLEHIRSNAIYDAIPRNVEKPKLVSNAFDDKAAVKQMLLVIAHNPEVKVHDILKLFSLYASSQQYVMQDIIADKSLMKSVLLKVTQSFSLMKPLDIQQLALSLRELHSQKLGYLRAIANNISIHCEKTALESDLAQSLELFDILLILYGNNVYRRDQFDTFMSLFEANINSAQPHDIVQILHYIGLGKNRKLSKEFADKAIRKIEPHFHTLTFADAGIAAAGVFKSGVNLDASSPFVQKTAQHLKSKIKETSSLINDLESYGIVAMIKLLRVAKYEDDDLLSHISEFVLKTDKSNLNPQVVPHVLAFYANSRVYNERIFSKLENVILESLGKPSYPIRIRDFTRLLWCFSYAGHKCSTQLFAEIDKFLMEFVHGSEIRKSPHLLSDSLLSLAICGHYPQDLIKEAFQPEMVKGLKGHQRSKQLSRLLTLYECLLIEVPELTVEVPTASQRELPMRTLSDEIFHRPALAKLMEGATFINEVLGAKVLKLKFILPNINYANLILDFNQLKHMTPVTSSESFAQQDHIIQQLSDVEEKCQGKCVAIELLDSHLLIQETLQPIGIVRLKLRLMRQMGWNVNEVLFTEVDECGNDIKAVAALIIDKITKCN